DGHVTGVQTCALPILLGVLCHQTQRVDAAVELLTRAAGLAPNAALIHFNLASTLRDSGEIDAAIASLGRAAVLAPDDARVHYDRSEERRVGKGGRYRR